MTRRDMILAAGVAAAWGLNFLVIDGGMGGIPPLLFVAVRFAVVALFIVVVPRPAASWRTIVGVGLFMSLGQFGLLYTSMALGLQPGLAALLLQAQAVFTVVIAAGVLHERPTPSQATGVVLGVVGLGVVAAGRGGEAPAITVALALAAALSWAIGNVISRRAGIVTGRGRWGALSLTVWSATVVPVPALVLAVAVDGPLAVSAGLAAFGPAAALSTLYTAGLCTLVGYAVFNGLLARNPSAAVVPWVLLAPVVAMVAAALLLGDIPTPAEIGGGALLVMGVLITAIPPRTRRRLPRSVRGTAAAGDAAAVDNVRGQPVVRD
ncbi:EamA family transporter [Microbacterium sp. SSW1-59]|uniref:EamA family transporter n=1 Tax=Microbacterium xanthum TaxID=3079794 RepID=UPI002AD328A0|nr:EamA family transporter [Microbacterium sp. SSW1-59]MDZ8201088.1 EamA family transporter [Microbacterium sp. SSW1-59]